MTEHVQFLSRCSHCLVIVDSSSPIEHTCPESDYAKYNEEN